MKHEILDAHVHCGRQSPNPPQTLEDYLESLEGTDISGAFMCAPVTEIYDRNDPDFQDDEQWRRSREEANRYLLELTDREGFEVIPMFFIWNDFAVEQLDPRHRGIKWHRHPGEPPYHYDAPRCARAIDEIRRRNMPVLLEEELDNTMRFLDELAPDVRVIIPHMGNMNGGYEVLQTLGVWERPNVYTDTSVSPTPEMIEDYLGRYGDRRMMFGSDFPFTNPPENLEKVRRVSTSDETARRLLGGNLRRLLAQQNTQTA